MLKRKEMLKRTVFGIMLVPLLISILAPAFNIQTAYANPKMIYADIAAPSSHLSLTIDWNKYHNYTEIVDILLGLNATYPTLLDVFPIGKSWQNRTIYCARLTNENATYLKSKVLFVGYHHARELISAELPLYFVAYATENYGTNTTITRLLDLSEIYVIVALNVDAFNIVKQNEWQRKNVHPFDEDGDGLLDEDPPDDEDGDGYIEDLYFWNGTYYEFIRWEGIDDDSDGLFNEDWVGGVDINRNYGYQWDAPCQSGSPYPWAEDYRGPTSFSEPETQVMRDLALQHNFKYAISFHSGADIILYPWGYTTTPTPHDSLFQEIAGNLSSLVGSPYAQSGAGLYTSSGLWDDWMYANRSTFALTCEIYTNNSAWQYEPGPEPDTYWEKGVFQFFNPHPNMIESTLLKWMPVFIYISNRTIYESWIMVPDEYATIQAAIDAASSGEQIFVAAGTYYEHVTVTKHNLTLVGERGRSAIIDGSGYGSVVIVQGNNLVLSGFTVQNGGWGEPFADNSGIFLGSTVESCNISDNAISTCSYGIVVWRSKRHTIRGNSISNTHQGIAMSGLLGTPAIYNIVDGNSIRFVNDIGIGLWRSVHNTIANNSIEYSKCGVYIEHDSSNNTVMGNVILSNVGDAQYGMIIWGRDNRIVGNTIAYNSYVGIRLNSPTAAPNWCTGNIVIENTVSNTLYGIEVSSAASFNTISGNNVHHNGIGISIDNSNNNTVTCNNYSNNDYGIQISSSNNTQIYHNNIINNTYNQAYLYQSFNTSWNDGYPSGGNHWSDYTGADNLSGPYQNETGSDGIGDTPYIIDIDNQDRYPLMLQYEPKHNTAVTDISPSKTIIGEGYTMSAKVTVRDRGDFPETFYVTLYVNTTSIETQFIILSSGNSMDVTFTWNTSGFAKGNYTISAYAWPVVGETATEDNNFTDGWVFVGTPGDVNGDKIINIKDAVILNVAFGSKQGEPTYNPNADINDDGYINIKDAVIQGTHFGQRDP